MQKNSEEELLSKIRLLSDKNLMAQVVADGLDNAKRFSWDKTYEQYRDLYEELLRSKNVQ
jgi:glycogen synthase